MIKKTLQIMDKTKFIKKWQEIFNNQFKVFEKHIGTLYANKKSISDPDLSYLYMDKLHQLFSQVIVCYEGYCLEDIDINVKAIDKIVESMETDVELLRQNFTNFSAFVKALSFYENNDLNHPEEFQECWLTILDAINNQ